MPLTAPPAAPTAPPSTPQRGGTGFSAAMNAFLVWLGTFRTWLATYTGWAATHVTELQALQADVQGAAAVMHTDTFKGVYSAGTTYAQGESVSHSGVYWLSNVNANLNNTPADGSAQWSRVYEFSSRAQVHAAVLAM